MAVDTTQQPQRVRSERIADIITNSRRWGSSCCRGGAAARSAQTSCGRRCFDCSPDKLLLSCILYTNLTSRIYCCCNHIQTLMSQQQRQQHNARSPMISTGCRALKIERLGYKTSFKRSTRWQWHAWTVSNILQIYSSRAHSSSTLPK